MLLPKNKANIKLDIDTAEARPKTNFDSNFTEIVVNTKTTIIEKIIIIAKIATFFCFLVIKI